MPCYAIDGLKPVVHPDAYVHPTAVLIGDVIIAAGVYIGPCASLRGDFGRIVMNENSNLQDSCVIHGFPGDETVVEDHGHIGHGAILHGCHIAHNAMVGMNAVVMDNAAIGESSIVAASAFVKSGDRLPGRSLIMGVPARVARELTDEEIAWKREGTQCYIDLARRSAASMVEVTPLTEIEADRPRLEAGDIQPLHRSRGD